MWFDLVNIVENISSFTNLGINMLGDERFFQIEWFKVEKLITLDESKHVRLG